LQPVTLPFKAPPVLPFAFKPNSLYPPTAAESKDPILRIQLRYLATFQALIRAGIGLDLY
jgi:hypothetical protein